MRSTRGSCGREWTGCSTPARLRTFRIRGFFDNLDRERLVEFVERRIGDQRLVRLIRKWLKAGVLEDGEWKQTQAGTPQGSVISPLLANL